MPLPIYLLGASIATGIAIANANRLTNDALSDRYSKYPKLGKPSVRVSPNSFISEPKRIPSVDPTPGSVACCEVFHELEHTGIWIDSDCIVEFSNNGLIKAVSPNRFIKNRSGTEIRVACNRVGEPLASSKVAELAAHSIFTYQNYDLLNNNCHSFVAFCLGDHAQVSTFSAVNSLLLKKYNTDIYWDKVTV